MATPKPPRSPNQPTPQPDDLGPRRMAALSLAILHHASANFAETARPASWETVLVTADGFLDWIQDGTKPGARR